MDTDHEHMGDEKKRMMWRMQGRQHMATRVLAAVIVIIFVFWCGFEFGEIRAYAGPHMGGMGMQGGDWGQMGTMQMHTTMAVPAGTTAAPATGAAAQ